MSASDTTISELFGRLLPPGKAPRSRSGRAQRLLFAHRRVAEAHADATFMRITTLPTFLDRSIRSDEIGALLDAAFDDLVCGAEAVRERRGLNDSATRLSAAPLLIVHFYRRFDEITTRGGNA